MKMPQQWKPQVVTASTEVDANLDMSAATLNKGLCPECRQPMRRATIDDREVWACVADRVALPIENA